MDATSSGGSYYDRFRKKPLPAVRMHDVSTDQTHFNAAQKQSSSDSPNRAMTDRGAYMSYLELQVERMSAACMTNDAYGERIEHLQAQVCDMHEKVCERPSPRKYRGELF